MLYKDFSRKFTKEIKKRGYIKREGYWVKPINDYYYLIDFYRSRFENLLLMSYCICFPFVDVEGKDENYYRDLIVKDYELKLDNQDENVVEIFLKEIKEYEQNNDTISKIIECVTSNKLFLSNVNARFLKFLGYEPYKNWRGEWKWKKTSEGEYPEYLRKKQEEKNKNE